MHRANEKHHALHPHRRPNSRKVSQPLFFLGEGCLHSLKVRPVHHEECVTLSRQERAVLSVAVEDQLGYSLHGVERIKLDGDTENMTVRESRRMERGLIGNEHSSQSQWNIW